MNKKLKLKEGTRLLLRPNRKSAQNLKRWKILEEPEEIINNTLTYKAFGNNKRGTLVEYFPEKFFSGSNGFKRSSLGQFLPNQTKSASKKELDDACCLFGDVFKKIKERTNEELNEAFPFFEVYFGFGERNDVYTSYIWIPDRKKSTLEHRLDDYLKLLKSEKADQFSMLKFLNIISTLIKIGECFENLENIDKDHLNLDPHNFRVFYSSDFDYQRDRILLDDISSLFSEKKLKTDSTGNVSEEKLKTGSTENASEEKLKTNSIENTSEEILKNNSDVDASKEDLKNNSNESASEKELKNNSDVDTSEEKLKTNSAVSALKELFFGIIFKTDIKEVVEDKDLEDFGVTDYLGDKDLYNKAFKECTALVRSLNDLKDLLTFSLELYLQKDLSLREFVDRLKSYEEKLIASIPEENLLESNEQIEILTKVVSEDPSDNTIAVIQNLLFQDPLYKHIEPEEKEIRVLVIGKGEIVTKFTDQVLQAGQMLNHKLTVDVLSSDLNKERKEYFKKRPALPRFVNVDGTFSGTKKSYANLNFKSFPPEADDLEDSMKSLILPRYHYVFIDLEEDNFNEQMAALIEKIYDENNSSNSAVYYTIHSEEETHNIGTPVYINQNLDVDSDRNINLLERMAFNTHLCWSDTSKTSLPEMRIKYNLPGYRSSSLAFALSLKYKLESVNINADDLNLAARNFQKIIESKEEKDKDIINELAHLEHRRWLIEKIVEGMDTPLDSDGEFNYKLCITGTEREYSKHNCLVRSEANALLLESPYVDANGVIFKEAWDNPRDEDLDLDELDTMSINLHRRYCEEKEDVISAGAYEKKIEELSNEIIDQYDSVKRSFNRLNFCIKNLISGNEYFAKEYDNYVNAFKKSLESVEHSKVAKIYEILDKLKTILRPVIQANLYVDYKKNDLEFIKNIPYIITNIVQPSLVEILTGGKTADETNTLHFQNVAAATVLMPKTIYYLYYYDEDTDFKVFSRLISGIYRYFNEKNFSTALDFNLLISPNLDIKKTNESGHTLEKQLKDLFSSLEDNLSVEETPEISINFSIIQAKPNSELVDEIEKILSEKEIELVDISNSLFTDKMLNVDFLEMIHEKYPHFEFDSEEKIFKNLNECEYLQYIHNHEFITPDDMFALSDACQKNYYLFDYPNNYKKLWSIYTGEKYDNPSGPYTWYILTSKLGKTYKENYVYEFEKPNHGSITEMIDFQVLTTSNKAKEVIFDINKIINALVRVELVDPNTVKQEGYKISFKTYSDLKTDLENLFKRLDNLASKNKTIDISLEYYPRGLKIAVNDLEVEKFECEHSAQEELLDQLEKVGLIKNLNIDSNGECSFYYTSLDNYKLLTQAGKMLEVYAFYKVSELGFFDSIVPDCEFVWRIEDLDDSLVNKEDQTKNEMDLILTKGFKSVFVECKAVKLLKQDYYHKLKAISDHFGINHEKVILALTYDKNKFTEKANELKIVLGEGMGINTIAHDLSSGSIGNIGAELRKLVR